MFSAPHTPMLSCPNTLDSSIDRMCGGVLASAWGLLPSPTRGRPKALGVVKVPDWARDCHGFLQRAPHPNQTPGTDLCALIKH